jgi:hypothetical protein
MTRKVIVLSGGPAAGLIITHYNLDMLPHSLLKTYFSPIPSLNIGSLMRVIQYFSSCQKTTKYAHISTRIFDRSGFIALK